MNGIKKANSMALGDFFLKSLIITQCQRFELMAIQRMFTYDFRRAPLYGDSEQISQDIPLWHVDYFELNAIKSLQAQEKLLPFP